MALSSPVVASAASSAGFTSVNDELVYYKSQYEQLELELQEFQASSRELETELERDIEASEKRERQLKEKVETLAFEVDEWKAKCKQSKSEANHAQTNLQKEITTLRDANRTLQLKLRDIEVANDDYERQARNTSSSLEDLESKYNVSIERGVMLEEEIKAGEQEREHLRIENQRLRDELSDLRIEAEIVQEKLKLAESALERHHISPIRASRLIAQDPVRPHSPASVLSLSAVALSSPLNPSSATDRAGQPTSTPPSPPLSDPPSVTNGTLIPKTPTATKPHPHTNPAFNPPGSLSSSGHHHWRPGTSMSRHGRTFSGSTTSTVYSAFGGTHARAPAPAPAARRQSTSRTSLTPTASNHVTTPTSGLPRSGSLYQIRGLIGKMQKLEERVHNARLKLPVSNTAANAGTSPENARVGSNVTMRSPRKRQSIGTSLIDPTITTPGSASPIAHMAVDGISGMNASVGAEIRRPGARTPVRDRSVASTSTATTGIGTASRPGSRASGLSKSTMGAPPPYVRPGSQASHRAAGKIGRSSAATPSTINSGVAADIRRPRSSADGAIRPAVVTSGSATSSPSFSSPASDFTPGHVYSRSVNLTHHHSQSSSTTAASSPLDEIRPVASRRTTMDPHTLVFSRSAIASPTKRQPFVASASVSNLLPSSSTTALATPSSSRRKSSGLPVRRQSSAACTPELHPFPSKVPLPPPVPPLPPHTDSLMTTYSAGNTPGRPSSRMAMAAAASGSSGASNGRVRAPTLTKAFADVDNNENDGGHLGRAGGGVELGHIGEQDMFDDMGETF